VKGVSTSSLMVEDDYDEAESSLVVAGTTKKSFLVNWTSPRRAIAAGGKPIRKVYGPLSQLKYILWRASPAAAKARPHHIQLTRKTLS
jgi:hypothetical protein